MRAYALSGLLVAVMLLVSSNHGQEQGRGRKYKPPPPTCKVTVKVVRAYNGKPVEDAAVVFHPLKDGKDDGNMELKTDEDGKVSIDVIPMGDTIRLQVIADGFQTYGREYDLPNDTKSIVVKLNRPERQYSIYESHPGNDGGQTTQQPQKPH
jgi:hypothetical protein